MNLEDRLAQFREELTTDQRNALDRLHKDVERTLTARLSELSKRLADLTPAPPEPDTAILDQLHQLAKHLLSVEQRLEALPDTSTMKSDLDKAFARQAAATNERLSAMDSKLSAPPPSLSQAVLDQLLDMDKRISAITSTVDKKLADHLADLQKRVSAPAPAPTDIDPAILDKLATLAERLATLEGRLANTPDPVSLLSDIDELLAKQAAAIRSRLDTLDEKLAVPPPSIPDAVNEYLASFDRRLSALSTAVTRYQAEDRNARTRADIIKVMKQESALNGSDPATGRAAPVRKQ